MHRLLLLAFGLTLSLGTFAQKTTKKKAKESLTIEVSSAGVSHTICVGDTVHLGYGSLPHGDFMYIGNGAPRTALDKRYASKSGVVYKVKYWKTLDQYQIYVKGKFGTHLVDIPQAIDKQEVIGFNSTFFESEKSIKLCRVTRTQGIGLH